MKKKTIRDKLKEEKIITCGKKKLPYVIGKSELKKLIGKADDVRLIVIMFFGVFLGLRVGEISRLKWEQVTIENGEVLVLDAKNTRRFKSGYGKDRIVPIMPVFDLFIRRWQAMNLNEEYVIPFKKKGDRTGNKNPIAKGIIRWIQYKFHLYLKELDMLEVDYYQKDGKPRHKYHVHTLRHVCGCNLRRCGMKIEDIRDFLGHEKIETTMIYAEMTKDDLKEAVRHAMNYPKQRKYEPQLEPASIEVVPDRESLKLMNENLRMMMELKKERKIEVKNAYLPE